MMLWGLISTLSGAVTSFGGMVATRFFLGFVEAAFLPGALLLLSKVSSDPSPCLVSSVDQDQWYTRRELTLRNAILFGGEYSTTHVSDNL